MTLLTRRLILPLLTAAMVVDPAWAAPRQGDPPTIAPSSSQAPSTSGVVGAGQSGALALTMRRSAGVVEVVVQGTGASPVLQQGGSGGSWQGLLRIGSPASLRFGPQRIALPEAGLQSVNLTGAGRDYQLQVVPMAGVPLGRPVVSANGRDLVISFPTNPMVSEQTARLDLRQPGTVPQPSTAPPLQPRAIAPPLGDMAVGSMVLRNQSFVNVAGPNVTLTLRNAPARDALMAIAQLGGYGFVFVDDAPTSAGSGALPASAAAPSHLVTISFRNESYARALNSVLLSAGLQGKRDGNMILVGPNVLGKSFGPQMSKVYRLNQASAASAADYLASLGAAITKVSVITNSVTQGNTQASSIQGGPASQQTQTQRITTTETYGGGNGPLKGLIGTTDSRLQTVTLVGDQQLVSIAESYLRQIDLRQRQVALSIKILDVSLDNDAAVNNSFAFRYGNNFIVNDRGQLVGAFGQYLPPQAPQGDVSSSGPTSNPGLKYPANNFYDLVQAVITSASTKTLASPTLFLSDNPEQNSRSTGSSSASSSPSGASSSGSGNFSVQSFTVSGSPVGRDYANEAFVVVGAQEITSYNVIQGSPPSPNTCEPVFQTAGLQLAARVKKIDDNGFVTFNLSPSISALTGTNVEIRGCGFVKTIAVRALDTGDVRVRDGQTLVLTGVISDQDIAVVSKWPILGDIPFVGQFFRGSSNGRKKRELVILVTPRIINDNEGGLYGYGYQPETQDSRRLVGSGG